MWQRIILGLFISLVILAGQFFLQSQAIKINLLLIVVICLSMRQSGYKWWLAIFGGLGIDVAYGTVPVTLSSLVILIYLYGVFNSELSFQSFLSQLLLIVAGVVAFLAINFFILELYNFIFSAINGYVFALNWSTLVNYFLVNILLVVLILAVFKKKKS